MEFELDGRKSELPKIGRTAEPVTGGRDKSVVFKDEKQAVVGSSAVVGSGVRDGVTAEVGLNGAFVIGPTGWSAREALKQLAVGLCSWPPIDLVQLASGTVSGGTMTVCPAARRLSTDSSTEGGNGSSLK